MSKILNRKFCRDLWCLTRSYWQSEEKRWAFTMLIAIIALSLGQVYMLVVLNKWYNAFYSALQEYSSEAVTGGLKEFCIIAAIYVTIAVYAYYLQQILQIRWRTWMTKQYLDEWLNDRTYYLLQLFEKETDNPDQRISDDIRLFVSTTLGLVLGLIKNTVLFVSFVGILWGLSGPLDLQPLLGINVVIPGYMVWATIIYAVVGTWLTDRIGRPLVKLNFDQQKYEADFRFSMVRLRENSENVAFYRGEGFEGESFKKRFGIVIENLWKIVRRQKQVVALTTGYSQISVIVPLALNIPRYLSRQINLGGLMQISSAFGRVQDALSFFVDMYVQIAEWQAVVARLTMFSGHMERIKENSGQEDVLRESDAQKDLQVHGLTIKLPKGENLIESMDLAFEPGSSWLVKGKSGLGKSTFLRTLAGIWPYAQGNVIYPAGHKKMFLPQRSYLPLGSLREVLRYPGHTELADEEIKKVLQLCQLPRLADYLDEEEEWAAILSLGEQQRIAFARALLQKPDWLFLDEATSAMDEELENAMYNLLKKELPETTLVSVGHRSTLERHHSCRLELTGGGAWQNFSTA